MTRKLFTSLLYPKPVIVGPKLEEQCEEYKTFGKVCGYNCCDCGGHKCGCTGCYSCNACDWCKGETGIHPE